MQHFQFSFLTVFLLLFAIIVGRYFLIAGIFQIWFYSFRKDKWSAFRLSKETVDKKQFLTEVKWSLITSIIFALVGTITFYLWLNGNTQLYSNLNQYSLWYLPVSLLIAMVIHETYYYWLHRWMHKPEIFRILHKVHHESKTTSPWTAFSFHPLEGFLQAIILPVTILVLPMHIYILLLQLIIMSISSVINHLEIEIYPGGFHKNFVGKWIIGATHHSLHHKQFKYNFGLYFTFWDKWKKTESPKYIDKLEKKDP